MIDNSATPSPAGRPARLGARLAAVVTGVVIGSSAWPAAAEPPATWEESDVVGTDLLLTLGGITLAVIAVISVLTYLPAMMRQNEPVDPALAFRERSEWFGGPRTGVEAATSGSKAVEAGASEESERGGGSGHW